MEIVQGDIQALALNNAKYNECLFDKSFNAESRVLTFVVIAGCKRVMYRI